MNVSKSIVLPILAIITLWGFIGMSYVNGGLFLDQLSIAGFIMTVIFIARIREALATKQSS